jgi:hypothetical protein
VSLRGAGIRSVERVPARVAPEAAASLPDARSPVEPAASSDANPDGDRAARWSELGRRLLATHPPAAHSSTVGRGSPVGGTADPSAPPVAAVVPAVPPAPARGPAGGGKAARTTAEPDAGLVIESLEVHVVAPAPAPPPAPAARRRPEPGGSASRADAWDPAVRHYVERW